MNSGKRQKGIKASMKFLGWAIDSDKKEQTIMCKFADLVQAIDDWIDVEDDLIKGINTPATLGRLKVSSIRRRFNVLQKEFPNNDLLLASLNHKIQSIIIHMANHEGS